MEEKSSMSVTIAGIILLFMGAWMLVVSLPYEISTMIIGRVPVISFILGFPISCMQWSHDLRFVTLLIALLLLIVGFNILRLKEWGRIIAVYFFAIISLLSIVVLIIPVLFILFGGKAEGIEWLLVILFGIFFCFILPSSSLWFFLTRPAVKDQFK